MSHRVRAGREKYSAGDQPGLWMRIADIASNAKLKKATIVRLGFDLAGRDPAVVLCNGLEI